LAGTYGVFHSTAALFVEMLTHHQIPGPGLLLSMFLFVYLMAAAKDHAIRTRAHRLKTRKQPEQ
jgi:hypothetical protein